MKTSIVVIALIVGIPTAFGIYTYSQRADIIHREELGLDKPA